jgi:predicted RNA-binding protein associated with RNAse of E/G family
VVRVRECQNVIGNLCKKYKNIVEESKLMKRKFADRPNWSRILKKSYKQISIDEENFYGYVSLLNLEEVLEPLIVKYNNTEICIVDDGYFWMQHFPHNGQCMMTTTFDDKGRIVQWYFDIIKKNGITTDGIPYCDDLFLDIVALPNGEIYTLDEEELLLAYEEGKITVDEYEYANSEGLILRETIRNKRNYLMNTSEAYFSFLRSI